ncbi:hypothetical protein DOTSEDRAFT_72751 [Dothistroma septosporum NZE10]|uniref:Uncharacterized protein n=1 Tax=Dothistroma septosporum (strain NZE10 / CBS 128990) TaxID=675120 RepID=M2YPC5_DOTSN|nr:hypothetical protein DOTSEDRAFT_72751 [Dothistroma septosporum NZE10]
MGSNNDNSPSNLWTRRSNSSKLALSVNKNDRNDSRDSHETPSKRFGSLSSHGKNNPFNSIGPISTSSVASPTGTGASSAFGLGSGAFASFGASGKTPKTPGGSFDLTKSISEKKDSSDDNGKDSRRPPARQSLSNCGLNKNAAESPIPSSKESALLHPLKDSWIIYYRKPTSKNSDYEKSITPMCRISTVEDFWRVYVHLIRPSSLPTVSDYHFFKEGIRPVWEDEENKKGGKWTMRLKKGVADRYWEDLLMAMVGDQFAEAGEEVCGAVVSVRVQEDVFSIWTKNDGGRNVKIRETIKRVLSLPPDTNLQWRSHDESITQQIEVDKARQEKANQDKARRNTLVGDKKKDEE